MEQDNFHLLNDDLVHVEDLMISTPSMVSWLGTEADNQHKTLFKIFLDECDKYHTPFFISPIFVVILWSFFFLAPGQKHS